MTAAPQTTPLATASEATASQLVPALRTAIAAALVAFALSFPIILLSRRIQQRQRARPHRALAAVVRLAAIVFVFVFLRQIAGSDWRIWFDRIGSIAAGGMGGALVRPRAKAKASRRPLPHASVRALVRPLRAGPRHRFPLVTLGLLGPAGSLKWIDSYGIQILIYVMLGWGLNIVVGLAGLLDLGYVAFYAVGAYSYALLATTFGLSFWICLPLAGILAAMWGMILGFPVLRLRGDYLAIVTLAFGEIIRLVLINWVAFTGGYAGIDSHPARHASSASASPTTTTASPRSSTSTYSPIHGKIFLYYRDPRARADHQSSSRCGCAACRSAAPGRRCARTRSPAARSASTPRNTKLTAFALGAFFGGFAGSFFAVRQGFVSPESFTFIESATILAIVVLGGMGSQIGVAHRGGGADRRLRTAARTRLAQMMAHTSASRISTRRNTAGCCSALAMVHHDDLAAARLRLDAHRPRSFSRSARPSPATSSKRGTADALADQPSARRRTSDHALRRPRRRQRLSAFRSGAATSPR